MLPHSPFLDFFFRTVLMAANTYVVILVLLTGYLFLKKDIFGRAFLVFAFGIILNPFLKSLFQVPLPPTAGIDGWSFPSGHMLTTTIFWAWLTWEYKNKALYIFTTLLLTCYGIGLVYFGYHYPADIAGALFFAILTLFLYHLLLKHPIVKNTSPLAGFLLTPISILLIFFIPDSTTKSHIWLGLGSLLGFAFGWLLSDKLLAPLPPTSLKIKFFTFFLSLLGLAALNCIPLFIDTSFFLINTLHYFIIALWLSAIAQIIIVTLLKKISTSKHIHKLLLKSN